MKAFIKRLFFNYKKQIILDKKSSLNYNVIKINNNSVFKVRIIDSQCNFYSLGEGCVISEARCYGDIVLGNFVTITGPGTVIKSLKEKINIGSFTSIGQNVCVVDFNHSFEKMTSSFVNHLLFNQSYLNDIQTKGCVNIEEDVWIGSNSVILPGVTIGRGSIIGAGSVITKNIPKYSVAFGNPAVVHSKRFGEDSIQFLENLKWWEWSSDKIILNKKLFETDFKSINLDKIKKIKDQIK